MKNKGISLITLIITIIVIIILASAIMISVTNGGLMDNAKKSKFLNDYKSVEEGVSIYSVSNVDVANPTQIKLPVESKLSLTDKNEISNKVPTLKTKIEEFNPGKTIDDIDLYWINESAAGVYGIPEEKKEKGYIIDVATRQIYDYVGDFFENKQWHTPDGGVAGVIESVDTQEMWDGWIKLTLFYPANSTDRKWRLGSEGEIRVDPLLMWQDYTGPITIPLDRIKDVWIKYKVQNEEVTVPPAGTLLVDIVPDKTGTTKVDKVNVNINYDSDATTREYKVGNSDWMAYNGPFVVTENCLIQARAKKVEYIYNTDGTFLMSRDIAGSDSVYIGNIGPEDITKVEDSTLAAPNITRLAPVNPDEKARVQVTYPDNAVKKVYKINYGEEIPYTSEISIAEFGTYVIAYYYDANGNRSLSKSIYINDTTTGAPELPKQYEPLPPYNPDAPIPYEAATVIKLPPPTITRLAPSNGSEKARIQITYPANAVRKLYTQNDGAEENYISQLSITSWGTYIMAYYYDVDGNKSQIAWIRVTETPTDPGTLDPIPVDPQDIVAAPTIKLNPSSGLTSQVTVSVVSPMGATGTFLKVGRYGTYQEYTGPVVVTDNAEVYAYYIDNQGRKSIEAKAVISNIIKKDESGTNNYKPYVYINANPYPWSGSTSASNVTINIVSSYSDKVEYSEDGIVYKPYTAPFVITENKRIYARGTNAYGVTDTYLDVTNIGIATPPKTSEILSVNINVNPDPILSTTKVAKSTISIEYDSKATGKYYSIGQYGTLQTYTGPFDITSSCTIYAYALSGNGKGETSKVVDNLLTGISNPSIVGMPTNSIQASKVTISIDYDKYATVKKYSINGGTLTDYTADFDVTSNCSIYAYSENSAGEKSSASYAVQNIIPPPPVLVLDRNAYYLLKLSYPEGSKGREYKWKEAGDWLPYKEDGILLIKPQYKDTVIKNGTLVKIEDENGNLITFTGDYYLIDVPISQLTENIFMRWDRVAPPPPQIITDPTTPTKQVTAVISYQTGMVKKQYRLLEPGGTLGDWLNYTAPIVIDRNNTVIYAKEMDESEVWSGEAMVKVTNIDEVAPEINLTADLTTIKQKVSVKVNVTDDVGVAKVKWAAGTQGESYFATAGADIANNSTVDITDNGYYTFYAEDQVGNTQVYTLNVENIDVLPPVNPTLAAAPSDWTKGNVGVTITYDPSASINEYSTNGTTWQAYTDTVVVTSNNITVYARSKDSAGNQSGVATLTVANIDRTNPVIAFGTNGKTNVETGSSTVTVTDTDGSGVNASSLQYVWDVQNTTTPSTGWTAFTNGANITKTGVEGTYYLWVKATDNVGNSVVSKTNAFVLAIQVVVNKPVLSTGMTAKRWNSSTNAWDTVSDPDNDTTWYNYANKEWANVQTADGSMWVWVPRYIYKISSGWHTNSSTPVVNVQFTRGIDDNWNSAVIGAIDTTALATASNNKWTNQPAFTFGTQEVTGIWVAKFSASGTTAAIDSKPGIGMLSVGDINTSFTSIRNMETNSRYGWGTTGERVDTHLIKNSEWGAVAYLSKSSYGKNTVQVTYNSTTTTGGGTGTSYITNAAQSTTGTVQGIYDMSSYRYTYVAAYLNDNSQGYLVYGSNLTGAAAKYKDVYTTANIYSATSQKGDAFYETTSSYGGTYEWFGSYIDMPYAYAPFFYRGGYYYGTSTSGMYSMENTYGSGETCSIRPVIVVAPKAPTVTVNPTATSPSVTATINYEQSAVVKQYRTLAPGGTLGSWLDYTGPLTITVNNTQIFSRAQDQYGYWSPDGSYTVTNVSPTNPVMSASPTTLTSGSVTVTIAYSADTTTKQYSYNGTTWVTYSSPIVVTTNNTTIYARGANSSGVYSGQSTITVANIEEGVANAPILGPGMTAVKWNSTTSVWDPVADPTGDTSWYDYKNKIWGNAQTADGSMWVWVPRYVYKITSGWHTNSPTPVVNIQFSQGTNDAWNPNRTINTTNSVAASNNSWSNHPAFTFGTTELTGIWVAKYMASGTTAAPDFKPGAAMLDMYSGGINGSFTSCRSMETNSRYGWGTTGTGFDTHLMKNTEWGAVAYLSSSSYGQYNIEITKNTTTTTGGGTGTSFVSAKNQSTTGNVYGVYDMSGVRYEYVASYSNDNSQNYLNFGLNLVNAAAKYKDVYQPSTVYSATSPIKGDAYYEVTTNSSGYNSAWFYNPFYVVYGYGPFCLRGGEDYYGTAPKKAGIYSSFYSYGSNTTGGYRPAIAVDNTL